MSAASKFRFVEAFPESSGYGPTIAVTLREDGRVLGYVRRIREPHDRGSNWAIYDEGGDEVGVSDLRSTAARWLERNAQ